MYKSYTLRKYRGLWEGLGGVYGQEGIWLIVELDLEGQVSIYHQEEMGDSLQVETAHKKTKGATFEMKNEQIKCSLIRVF